MKIKYRGGREGHKDTIYGTGEWKRGEVKEVPDLVAKKMLLHVEVYAESDTKKPVASVNIVTAKDTPDMSKVQETYDMVNVMGKDALKTFIANQFGRNVDLRLFRDVVPLRAYAIQLVDQYGVLQ